MQTTAAGCLTVTEVLAAVMVTERSAAGFAATVSVTVPGPEPDVAEAVIQAGRPVIVHAQPGVAWMARASEPPPAGAVKALGVAEGVHVLTGVSIRTAFAVVT